MQRRLIAAVVLAAGVLSGCGRNGSIAPAIPLPQTQQAYSPSYGNDTAQALPEGRTPKKLTISPATAIVPIGTSVQLTGTVFMDNGQTINNFTGLTFTLPNTNDQGPVIQKRDSQGGVFVGQREGTVTVTGTVGDLTATATIQVVKANNMWTQIAAGTTNDLKAVKMINDMEGWAVGNAGTILRFQNGNWFPVRAQRSSNANLTGIDFADVNDGWAVGDSSILHFTNGVWQEIGTPSAGALKAIDMTNINDGWIVGENGGKGVVLRFQGGQWADAGAGIKDPLNAVSAIAPNDVWAVGESGFGRAPAIYHFDGTSWSKAKFGEKWPNIKLWSGSYKMKGIKMLNGSQGWAVGSYAPIGATLRGEQGVMFKYDANLGTWLEVKMANDDPKMKNVTYNSVGMMGGNKGWVLGNVTQKPLDLSPTPQLFGNLMESDGQSVTISSNYQAKSVGSGFYGIDVLYNGNGAIVGDQGLILMHLYDVNRPTQSNNTGGYTGSYNSNYNNAGGGYYGNTGGGYNPYGGTTGGYGGS
ncbi:MAG: hypothetical protein H7338_05800 [Candidatus Sericytochromatia bacterium]|nr:hypothetical protein [Candidatus Sericytochromatia bacterium]